MSHSHITELENLVSNAVDCVEFKLIRSQKDVYDSSNGFHPLMAHQIFGENENIFGYKDLKVEIMYTAGLLQIYVGIKYSHKVKKGMNTINADDVISTITSKLPDGCYFTELNDFLKTLQRSKKFSPFGTKIDAYTCENQDGSKHTFEIYFYNGTEPKFAPYFGRLQSFVLWFIDAACYISTDDPQWRYFICYEKYKNCDGEYEYATIAYTTVYQYYTYPEHIRPRISQMLILPPFQKLGLGTKLMEAIYQHYASDSKVIDITVEDPSTDYQRLRNFVDAKFCKNLSAFSKDVICNGFNKEMIEEARKKYKINPRQCRKVYEILRLYHTNLHNEIDYKAYRLTVKQRLNINYYKQIKDIEKLEKVGLDTQWLRASIPTLEDQLKRLEKEYEEIEDDYLKIVQKLKNL